MSKKLKSVAPISWETLLAKIQQEADPISNLCSLARGETIPGCADNSPEMTFKANLFLADKLLTGLKESARLPKSDEEALADGVQKILDRIDGKSTGLPALRTRELNTTIDVDFEDYNA